MLNPSALVPTTIQDLDSFVDDLSAILHFGGEAEENSKGLGSVVSAMSQLEVASSVLKKSLRRDIPCDLLRLRFWIGEHASLPDTVYAKLA